MNPRSLKRKKNLEKKKEIRQAKVKKLNHNYVYLMTLQYDGSEFIGYAKQKFSITIQQNIENTLQQLLDENTKTIEASRTDRGVHALDQKVMFKTNQKLNLSSFLKQINDLLPNAIKINNIELKDSHFHARYDVVSKSYIYKINTINYFFIRNYSYSFEYKITQDIIEKINFICELFIGKHDFISFSGAKSDTQNTIRTIYSFEFKPDEQYCKNHYFFKIEGDGFLYKMIRILIGSILYWIKEDYEIEKIKSIITNDDKKKFGETIFAGGLYLEKINYK